MCIMSDTACAFIIVGSRSIVMALIIKSADASGSWRWYSAWFTMISLGCIYATVISLTFILNFGFHAPDSLQAASQCTRVAVQVLLCRICTSCELIAVVHSPGQHKSEDRVIEWNANIYTWKIYWTRNQPPSCRLWPPKRKIIQYQVWFCWALKPSKTQWHGCAQPIHQSENYVFLTWNLCTLLYSHKDTLPTRRVGQSTRMLFAQFCAVIKAQCKLWGGSAICEHNSER